jgi:carbonic anhydrase/acetyltransferase-like protein (isoleucine patch superfamily)
MSGLIVPYGDARPRADASVYLAPGSAVVGDVEIDAESSLWPGAVLRGDEAGVRVGERSNIQDRCVVHVEFGTPTIIGCGVSVGHAAVLHGCVLEDGCLIGVSATVLDGAVIGKEAFIAAGAVVLPGVRVGPRELWGGVPARRLRDLNDDDLALMTRVADNYVKRARQFKEAGETDG